jgi:predicted RNase H-like HicB family nuclease
LNWGAVMSKSQTYAYVIEHANDGLYWAYLPDLPGCATSANSPEQVERQLREVVDLYLSYFRVNNLPAPVAQTRAGHLTIT